MSVRTRLVAMILLASAALVTPVWSQEPPPAPPKLLTVELASGRKFTGVVDVKTNEQQLVLRFTRGTATLKRPIGWSRVVKATVDGEAIEPGKLRETAMVMRVEGPGFGAHGTANRGQGTGDRSQGTGAREQEPGAGNQVPAELLPASRVTSVTFDARLANWDWDVETDGLILEILPISADGYLTPASGTAEVELFAPQKRSFSLVPLSGGDTLERVERWTKRVDLADFGVNGARLKLPFGAVHPEFDLDWIGVGLVHVRLVVPGDGVFDDSVDGLRIRPYAPLRDRYEMQTGRRFLPTERVGRHD
jgi:hypothetical protein